MQGYMRQRRLISMSLFGNAFKGIRVPVSWIEASDSGLRLALWVQGFSLKVRI